MNDLSLWDNAVIWHPYTQMKTSPFAIGVTHGKGAYLYTEDNSRYLDCISSWWVNLHGHCHPYITNKVHDQLQKLEHVIFAGFTHQPAIELAERLLKIVPGSMNRVFYSDNGSTAVEVGLKMALQFWANKGIKKQKVLALKNAYHGDTFGAMSVSGRSTFTEPFNDLLFEVVFIDPPYLESSNQNVLRDLEAAIYSSDEYAALIYEPMVQGTAGMRMFNAEIFNRMLSLARSKDIILIADEVMTGFGRTGKLFASEYFENDPDIICLSKGLTGGTMPLGVTACSKMIYEAFLSDEKAKALFHGHSFTANPLACAAANASLDLLLEPEVLKAIDRITDANKLFVNKIKSHPGVRNARSLGTILAIDVETNGVNTYFNNLSSVIYEYFIQRHLLIRPLGNTIYLIPPYCITESELETVYHTIKTFLDEQANK